MHEPMLAALRDLRAAKAAPTTTVTFKAIETREDGVIIGIGSSDAWDSQGEAMKAEAVVSIAYQFCAKSDREFRVNHDPECIIGCDLVASFPGTPIVGDDGTTIVGINFAAKATHWFVGVRPHDPQYVEAAKAGKLVGFSWGGFASKVE